MSSKTSQNRVLWLQATAFALFIAFLWLSELFDLPHNLLGTPATPVNLAESAFHTVICLLLGTACIIVTAHLQRQVRYLEGFLVVCSGCKRVRVEGEWMDLELYLHQQAGTELSHGLCEECLHRLYPDIADAVKNNMEKV